jgi:O-antigen/teichoic acid export membrane protein
MADRGAGAVAQRGEAELHGEDATAAGRPEPPARSPQDYRLHGILDVRGHLARGALVNGTFDLALLGLTALRGVAVAAFVSRADYGVWGLVGLTLWTALGLKSQFGAGEKYVQQSDADQERAFQRGFTMELLFTAATIPAAAGALAVVDLVSGDRRVLLPGLALLLLLPATALQFPSVVLYRRLQFRRQRTLLAIEPVLGAVVAIGLAVAGAGYWSFVAGALCGSWALALASLRVSPYRLAWRYDPGTLRQYVAFSAPLLVSGLAVLALFYIIYLVGSQALGVAGLGAFTLVGNLVQFTDQADGMLTGTLYPAVCAVQDRLSLLSEIFVKSNRLSLIWAVPFGVGMALFASDLVRFVLGTRWQPAVPVLVIMGLVTAVHHVGYNWSAFVKARGLTWPIGLAAVATTVVTIGAGVPLMYTQHLVGLGVAFAIGEVVAFAIRGVYVARMFVGVRILTQLVRGFAPVAVSAGAILLGRALLGPEQSLSAAIAAFALYVALTVAASWLLERSLLREAVGYLARRGVQPT